MAGDGSSRGARYAALGGGAALAATVLLPFHLGGGLGTAIAIGFAIGGVFLGLASLATGRRFSRAGGGWMRAAAALGAAGFVVSGLALVGDVVERPFVTGEVAAIAATAVWWAVVGRRTRREGTRFAGFSLLAAAGAGVALLGQVVWEPPAGAVPARFAYVLWGPWGLWLAAVLSRRRRPRS